MELYILLTLEVLVLSCFVTCVLIYCARLCALDTLIPKQILKFFEYISFIKALKTAIKETIIIGVIFYCSSINAVIPLPKAYVISGNDTDAIHTNETTNNALLWNDEGILKSGRWLFPGSTLLYNSRAQVTANIPCSHILAIDVNGNNPLPFKVSQDTIIGSIVDTSSNKSKLPIIVDSGRVLSLVGTNTGTGKIYTTVPTIKGTLGIWGYGLNEDNSLNTIGSGILALSEIGHNYPAITGQISKLTINTANGYAIWNLIASGIATDSDLIGQGVCSVSGQEMASSGVSFSNGLTWTGKVQEPKEWDGSIDGMNNFSTFVCSKNNYSALGDINFANSNGLPISATLVINSATKEPITLNNYFMSPQNATLLLMSPLKVTNASVANFGTILGLGESSILTIDVKNNNSVLSSNTDVEFTKFDENIRFLSNSYNGSQFYSLKTIKAHTPVKIMTPFISTVGDVVIGKTFAKEDVEIIASNKSTSIIVRPGDVLGIYKYNDSSGRILIAAPGGASITSTGFYISNPQTFYNVIIGRENTLSNLLEESISNGSHFTIPEIFSINSMPSIYKLSVRTDQARYNNSNIDINGIAFAHPDSTLIFSSSAADNSINYILNKPIGGYLGLAETAVLQDKTGVVEFSTKYNKDLTISSNYSIGLSKDLRLKEARFTGEWATHKILPKLYTSVLTFDTYDSANVFISANLGNNGIVNMNNDVTISAVRDSAIKGNNTKFNLNSNTLELDKGNIVLTGDTVFNSTFDADNNKIGNIIVNNQSYKPEKSQLFIEGIDQYTAPSININLNVISNTSLPKTSVTGEQIKKDSVLYSYNMINGDNASIPILDGDVIVDKSQENIILMNNSSYQSFINNVPLSFKTNEKNLTIQWYFKPQNWQIYASYEPAKILDVIDDEINKGNLSDNAGKIVKELVAGAEAGNQESAEVLEGIAQEEDERDMINMLEDKVPDSADTQTEIESTGTMAKTITNRMLDVFLDLGNSRIPRPSGDYYKSKYGIWVSGFYQQATQHKIDQDPGFVMKNQGLIIGIDTLLTDNFGIGIAWNRTHTDTKYLEIKTNNKSSIDTNLFTLYSHQILPRDFFIQEIVGGGFSNVNHNAHRKLNSRTINTSNSKYRSNIFMAKAIAGKIWNNEWFTFTPQLGVNYSYFGKSSYKETGGSIQNYKTNKDAGNLSEAMVGFKVNKDFLLSNGWLMSPQIMGFAYIKISDTASNMRIESVAFNNPIVIKGERESNGWYSLQGELNLRKEQSEISTLYECQLDNKYISHELRLRYKYNF